MSQTTTAAYAAKSSQGSKALEVAFVIAGWPTVYTIAKESYTPAGDLAAFSGFKAWASIPKGAAAKVKGRPEEGSNTIGELTVPILDRVSNGSRALTDLLSREAYLEGTSSGHTTTLTANAGSSDTELQADTTGFPSSGVIYVGIECVKYTGIASSPSRFTGCTRGHLLTSPYGHVSGIKVYSFMPSIYRRKAFLYKGYQDLGVSDWARAFGGIITGIDRSGPTVTFKLASTTWETYGRGIHRLVRGDLSNIIFRSGRLGGDLLSGDFTVPISLPSAGNVGNGHYTMQIGGTWSGIQGVS